MKTKIFAMLDVFNICIELQKLPVIDSPCQKKIIEILLENDIKSTVKKGE